MSGVFETKKEALEKALEKAELIGSKSPVAVMGTKEVINFSRDHSVQDGEFAAKIAAVIVERLQRC